MTSILKKIMDKRSVGLDIGVKPLICSACLDGNIDIVEVLLNAGANVNVYSFSDRRTPVRIALDAKNDKLVKMLVKHGADINYSPSLPDVGVIGGSIADLLRAFFGTMLVDEFIRYFEKDL